LFENAVRHVLERLPAIVRVLVRVIVIEAPIRPRQAITSTSTAALSTSTKARSRQALFAIPLAALVAACADGRGSTGFDITDRASRIEAASTVAVSNLDTLIAFGGGSNGGGASCPGSREAAGAMDSRSTVLPDEGEALCTEEGNQDFQCVEADGVFTATRFLLGTPRGADCAPGANPFAQAEIFLSAADPGTCTGKIPGNLPVECGFRDTLLANRGENDLSALLVDFTARFEPSGSDPGCAQPQSFGLLSPAFNPCTAASKGTLTLNGSRSDLDTCIGCPKAPFEHLLARFENLTVELDASGSPCVLQAKLNGQVDRENRATAERFSTIYEDFVITETQDGDGVLITQNGTIDTDCLGDLEYETLEPLRLAAGETCPTAGLLRIRLSDGRASLTRYTESGGAELDFDADGKIDKTAASCTGASLRYCAGGGAADLCKACNGDADCREGLVCLPCSFECTGETKRCVGFDDLGGCEDGIY
jgi:hypothetical protein